MRLRWVDYAGLVTSVLYGILAYLSHEQQWLSLPLFLSLFFTLASISFGLFFYFRGTQYDTAIPCIPIRRIIAWSVIFHIIAGFGVPIFEDDFYRYLWDGYRFFETGTPYGIAPSALFAESSIDAAFQSILNRMNYPDVATIYAPVTQYTFLLGYWVSPGQVTVLQMMYSLLDIVVIFILYKIAKPHYVLLYAWCPLVIKEVAFTAHPDIVGVVLLMGAILCHLRGRKNWTAVLLGLSICAKIFAVLFLPLLLARANKQQWGIVLGIVLLVYLPFIWQSATDMIGLVAFAKDWHFNALLFDLFTMFVSVATAKLILAVFFISWYVFYWRQFCQQPDGTIPRGDWVLGLFFLISPVINPWYVVWLLPFAVIYPSAWAWSLSVAVILAYVSGINMQQAALAAYAQPWWAKGLEIAVLIVACFYDSVKRQWTQPYIQPPIKAVSLKR